jgi:hypothetical protein
MVLLFSVMMDNFEWAFVFSSDPSNKHASRHWHSIGYDCTNPEKAKPEGSHYVFTDTVLRIVDGKEIKWS